jgi:hypothetical protein
VRENRAKQLAVCIGEQGVSHFKSMGNRWVILKPHLLGGRDASKLLSLLLA